LGPKRDEVTGGWRQLHNEELRDLYSLLIIIRMVESRRMRWEGHVALIDSTPRIIHKFIHETMFLWMQHSFQHWPMVGYECQEDIRK
jgi:hypothetical protein